MYWEKWFQKIINDKKWQKKKLDYRFLIFYVSIEFRCFIKFPSCPSKDIANFNMSKFNK